MHIGMESVCGEGEVEVSQAFMIRSGSGVPTPVCRKLPGEADSAAEALGWTPPLSQSPAVLQVTGHGCPLPLPPRPAAKEEKWSCSLRDHQPIRASS